MILPRSGLVQNILRYAGGWPRLGLVYVTIRAKPLSNLYHLPRKIHLKVPLFTLYGPEK